MMRTAAIDLLKLADDGVERPAPGTAPVAFRIWRAGVTSTDMGDQSFTERSAKMLLGDQAGRQNLYSIDVDHLSLKSTAPPEARKAVGWHKLEVRKDAKDLPELWATEVEWTDVVKAGLEKNPPEWRYFSPAYDLDPKTREVTSYLNTALTNNPATWAVTALATKSTQERAVMTKKEMVAALTHMSKGESPEAQVAGAMLAVLESGKLPDDSSEPDADDEKKKEAAEDPPKKKDEPDADDEKKKKEEEAIAVAASAHPGVLALAAQVQSLTAKLAEREQNEERTKLLASRPDLTPEVVKVLAAEPLETLRFAVKTFPRGIVRSNLAAAAGVTATRGEGQGGDDDTQTTGEAHELDVQMGLAPRTNGIRREGTRLVLGCMTPVQARAVLATRERAANAANEGKK